jgi:hypothetical protein
MSAAELARRLRVPKRRKARKERQAAHARSSTCPTYCRQSARAAELGERCGKNRLLGLLARVCFNASPVTAHPAEAQVYRSAARTGGVQLFDEVETLRGDKDRWPSARAAIAEMRGRWLLLGPDCPINPDTPKARLHVARC